MRRIEESPGAVSGLSMVAESAGRIVGHVLMSHVGVATADGARQVIALGPLAVLPSHQRRGIGSALVEAALRTADALGESAVIILGSPDYYARFGFVPAAHLGLEAPAAFPAEHFLARALSAYDPNIRGLVVYGEAWDGAAP